MASGVSSAVLANRAGELVRSDETAAAALGGVHGVPLPIFQEAIPP